MWKPRANPAVLFLMLLGGLAVVMSRSGSHMTSQTEFMMDTVVEIKAPYRDGSKVREAMSAAFKEMDRVDKLLSRYNKGSDVWKLNAAAGRGPVKISREALTVLRRAQYYYRLTGGAFDVTVGPLVDLWGIGTEREGIPKPAELEKALSLVDGSALLLDSGKGSAMLAKKHMSVDLGAIAKGYAVDRGMRVLVARGLKSAMINAGSSSIGVKGKRGREPWRVGISDPFKEGGLLGTLEVADSGNIGTSSDTQRYFTRKGVRYHHLLDPVTGYPARASREITVTAPTAMDADALSTVGFVLDPEKAVALAARLKGVRLMAIPTSGRILRTPGFRIMLTDDGRR